MKLFSDSLKKKGKPEENKWTGVFFFTVPVLLIALSPFRFTL